MTERTINLLGIELNANGFKSGAAGHIAFLMDATNNFMLNWGFVDIMKDGSADAIFSKAFSLAFGGAVLSVQADKLGDRKPSFFNPTTTGMTVILNNADIETIRIYYLAWGN